LELVGTLVAILGAVLLGAMSPGPSFFLVTRSAIAHSRRHALVSAFAMGLGGAVFACLAAAGLAAVLTQWTVLYAFLKCAGGAYVLYLAFGMFRSSEADPGDLVLISAADRSLSRSFWVALATQLSNPKTAVVYASIFAALLPEDVPMGALAALPILVFLVEASWYALVAVTMSTKAPRRMYLRWRTIIDRIAAVVLGALGGKLFWDGVASQLNPEA
jgi:threonine/homoserine/homoserine lactone efflux protein